MNWPVAPLSDLLLRSIGGIWGKQPGEDEIDVRVWRVTELRSEGRLDPSSAARRSISRRQYETRALQLGDLLLEKSGGGPTTPVGRVGLVTTVPEPSVCSNFMQLLRPCTDLVDSRYLHLFLNHVHATGGTLRLQTSSTNIRNIKASEYTALGVPLPSLEEQRRIVDILEDHLSRIDAATIGLRAASRRVDTFRSSVIFSELEAAGGDLHTIDEVAALIRNGIFVSRPGTVPNGVPILRIGAVRPLMLDLSDLRYSERSADDLAADHSLLMSGDLLFTRYNGNTRFVGACAVVPADVGPLTYPDKLIRVVLDTRIALPEFIALACSVGRGREQIQRHVKTTSGQSGISGRDLRAVRIALPSLATQDAVVRYVHAHLDSAARLVTDLAAAERRADMLRQSLLRAAFSGQLTGSSTNIRIVEELSGV